MNLKEQACSSPCSDFPVIPVLALRPSTKHRLSSVVDVELCGDVRQLNAHQSPEMQCEHAK